MTVSLDDPFEWINQVPPDLAPAWLARMLWPRLARHGLAPDDFDGVITYGVWHRVPVWMVQRRVDVAPGGYAAEGVCDDLFTGPAAVLALKAAIIQDRGWACAEVQAGGGVQGR